MLTQALTPAQLPGPDVGAGVVEVGTVVGGALVGGTLVVGGLAVVVGGALVGGGAGAPFLRTFLMAWS